MADKVNAKDNGGGFTAHEEGQFAAVCVDVIDLGQRIDQYPGKPARIVDKCALVFVTDSEGETKDVSAEFTVSMGERATLRAFLESWRGKGYTADQAREGVPLDKLCGNGALLSIEHKTSQKGRTYAKVKSISPLPKALPKPDDATYSRPDFWEERKKAYRAETEAWADAQAKTQARKAQDVESMPDVDSDDSDLPF